MMTVWWNDVIILHISFSITATSIKTSYVTGWYASKRGVINVDAKMQTLNPND